MILTSFIVLSLKASISQNQAGGSVRETGQRRARLPLRHASTDLARSASTNYCQIVTPTAPTLIQSLNDPLEVLDYAVCPLRLAYRSCKIRAPCSVLSAQCSVLRCCFFSTGQFRRSFLADKTPAVQSISKNATVQPTGQVGLKGSPAVACWSP